MAANNTLDLSRFEDVTQEFTAPDLSSFEDVTQEFAGPDLSKMEDVTAEFSGDTLKPAAPKPSLGEYARLLPASIAKAGGEAFAGISRIVENSPTPSGMAMRLSRRLNPELPDAAQLGRDIADRSLSDYGVTDSATKTIPGKLIAGAGSVVPIIASGPANVLSAAGLAGESARDEAEQMGATEDQQAKAFIWNAVVGAVTEKLMGVPALLKSAKGTAADVTKSIGRKIGEQVAKSFGREGSQETLQQFGQDAIAKWVAAYDPDRNLFDLKKITETFLIGGVIGGGLGGVTQLAAAADARLKARQATLPSTSPSTVTPPATPSTAPATEAPQEPSLPQEPTPAPEPDVVPSPGVSPEEVTSAQDPREEQIVALLARHKLSTDESEKQQLWAQAMELDKQIIAEEQGISEEELNTPEAEMAAVATEAPPPVAPLNPERPPVEPPPDFPLVDTPEAQMEAVATSEPPPVSPINPEPEPVIQQAPPAPPPVQPESAPSPQEPTIGVRNAITDQIRKAMDLPERVTPSTYRATKQLEDAEAAVQANPSYGTTLVDEVNAKPRTLSTLETNVVLYELAARTTAYKQAVTDANAATTAEEQASAQERVGNALKRVQEVVEATATFGTEQGRALEARKRLIAQQYELPIMQATLQATKGEELTAQESEKVTKLSTEIAESDQRVSELEEQNTATDQKAIFDNLLVEEGKTAEQRAKAGKTLLDTLKTGHDEALKNIRRRLGQVGSGPDPSILFDVARIGAYHIANGVKKLADFTKAVVAEVGEWIRPNIKEVFDRSKEIHDANQKAFGTPAKAKRARKPADVAALAAKDSEKGTLSHRTAYEMVRQKIQQGVEGFDAVMQAATDELSALIPRVDRKQVGLAFSEYGKTQFPSQEDLAKTLSEYRRIEQLAQAIADVQAGKPPKKSGPQRNKPTQNVREMMAKLKAEMDAAGIETQSPEEQLASRNQARETALKNQIADLEKRIATGEKKVKGATTPDSAAVTELKKKRDALKAEADRLFPEDDSARRVQSALKAIERSTKDVQRRIREKDFTPKPKRDPVVTKELQEERFKNAKAKREYAEMLFEEKLRRENKGMKALRAVGNVSNLARSIITSIDLSAVLRQGGFISTANPIRAFRAFPDMLKAMMSEKGAQAVADDIADRNNAKSGLYAKSKLYLADQDSAHPSKVEEAYMSRWLRKNALQPDQPIRNVARLGKNVALAPVRASARAYTAFLNKLRADSFDAMVASLDVPPTTEEAQSIANFINVATGRGNLGRKGENASEFLSTVFFSPRYAVSRFQLLTGQPMYGGTARTRKLVAKEYVKALGGLAVTYGLLALWAVGAGDDDDAPKLETDPRSTDFGKVRIGNTRLDPSMGLAQATTFLSQEFTGEKKGINKPGEEGELSALRESELRPLAYLRDVPEDEKIKPNRFGSDLTGSFLRKKLAPLPGAMWNLLKGSNVIGEPVTVQGELVNQVIPLSIRDIIKTAEEQGMSRSAVMTALSIMGMGVNTYLTDEQREAQRER